MSELYLPQLPSPVKLRTVATRYLWERVHPRTPAQPVPSTASPASRVNPLPQGPHQLKECAVPVGAGAPANTGLAGAIHRVACFAGMPAPTGSPSAEGMHHTCGSGFTREHRRSRCHPPRRLLRGHARSHRVDPPAEGMRRTCGSGFTREHRRSRCHPPRRLLRGHAHTGWTHQLKECAVPVGAGSPANTGAAGAIHRVACFAGMPAPTGSPPADRVRHTCGFQVSRQMAGLLLPLHGHSVRKFSFPCPGATPCTPASSRPSALCLM